MKTDSACSGWGSFRCAIDHADGCIRCASLVSTPPVNICVHPEWRAEAKFLIEAVLPENRTKSASMTLVIQLQQYSHNR